MSNAATLAIPGVEFGGGGLVGFLIGYGLKKIAKLLLIVFSVLVALVSIPLAYLSYKGIITINYSLLMQYVTQAETYAISTATWLYTTVGGMTQSFPTLGGLGMGFTLNCVSVEVHGGPSPLFPP